MSDEPQNTKLPDEALTHFWQELLTNLSLPSRLAPIYLFVPHSGVAASLRQQIAAQWQAHPDWAVRVITDIAFDPYIPSGMRAIVRPYLANVNSSDASKQHPALWLDLSPRETVSAKAEQWEIGRESALQQLNLMRTELERDCLAPLVIVLPQQTIEMTARGDKGRIQPWIRHAALLCPDMWHIRRLSLEVPGGVVKLLNARRMPESPKLEVNPPDPSAVELWHSIVAADRIPTVQETAEAFEVLGMLARYQDAAELVRQWLIQIQNEKQKNVWAEFRHEIAKAHQMLGSTYSRLKLHEQAEVHIRLALAEDEHLYGIDTAEVAIDLSNLGGVLVAAGRISEAEACYQRALEIDEACYGSDHPAVATDLNNLALLFKNANRLGDAEPLYRRSLEVRERIYGTKHPAVANALNNLASLFQVTHRPDEAELLYRRALAIYEAVSGKDHPDTARSLNNLAGLLFDTNRKTQAEPLLHRQLEILVRFKVDNGYHHPSFNSAKNNFFELLKNLQLPETEIKRRLDEVLKPLQPDARP